MPCDVCHWCRSGASLHSCHNTRYLNEYLSAFSEHKVTWMINELLCWLRKDSGSTNHKTQSCAFEQNEIGETVTVTTFILIKAKLKGRDSGWEVGGWGWGWGGQCSRKQAPTKTWQWNIVTGGRKQGKDEGRSARKDQILLPLWRDLGQRLTPAIIFRSQTLSHSL